MEIKLVKLADIKPYFNNPRDNTRAVEPTMQSIMRYSFVKPILVDKEGVIVAGHTRYIAAFRLGLKEVPVIYSDMDDEQNMAFRVADNKLAELGYMDDSAMVDELKKLGTPTDMQAFFFEDLNSLLNFNYQSMAAQMPESQGGAFEENPYSFMNDDEYEISDMEVGDEQFGDEGEQEPEDEPAMVDDGKVQLYKRMRDENGREFMYILCPYCNNVEKAYLDE